MSDLRWCQLVRECIEARGLVYDDAMERLRGNHLYLLGRAEFLDSRGDSIKEPTRLVHEALRQILGEV